LPASRPRLITPEVILDETAKMFGFTNDELCGKSRRRPLVTARFRADTWHPRLHSRGRQGC